MIVSSDAACHESERLFSKTPTQSCAKSEPDRATHANAEQASQLCLVGHFPDTCSALQEASRGHDRCPYDEGLLLCSLSILCLSLSLSFSLSHFSLCKHRNHLSCEARWHFSSSRPWSNRLWVWDEGEEKCQVTSPTKVVLGLSFGMVCPSAFWVCCAPFYSDLSSHMEGVQMHRPR